MGLGSVNACPVFVRLMDVVVLALGDREQVNWVDAQLVSANVVDVLALGDRAKRLLVDQPMGEHALVFPDCSYAIAVSVNRSCPRNAVKKFDGDFSHSQRPQVGHDSRWAAGTPLRNAARRS